MKPTLLVLAAGIGSRYGGLKQLDKVGPSGETIIDYSIFDAIRAGFSKVVFVIRKNIENEFKNTFGNKFSDKIDVEYVFQEINNVPEGIVIPEERVKPWGTGHALLAAQNNIDTPFAVINADDFYGYQSFKIISEYLNKRANNENNYCMVGFMLKNTLSEFGYVSRGICKKDNKDLLLSVTERTHITINNARITYKDNDNYIDLSGNEIASMNLFGFTPSIFNYSNKMFEDFIKKNINNLKSEFYIPLIVNNLIKSDIAKTKVLNTPEQWFGVTYKEDKQLTVSKLKELTDSGVYPQSLW